MPFTETFSLATVKQSPAPQHHSPAALRNPPRLIQVSCADASEPIAKEVPTKPTSATERGIMTVPPRANASPWSRFLDPVRRSVSESGLAAGFSSRNFKPADAVASCDRLYPRGNEGILDHEIARRRVCAGGGMLAGDRAGEPRARAARIRGRAQSPGRRRPLGQSQRAAEPVRRRDQAARQCRSRLAAETSGGFGEDAGHSPAGQSGRRPERQAEVIARSRFAAHAASRSAALHMRRSATKRRYSRCLSSGSAGLEDPAAD